MFYSKYKFLKIINNKMKLEFRPISHFSKLSENIEFGVFSGIYIWGFKKYNDDCFLPYYVGLADKISIYERLIHHYTCLDQTYKIFDTKHINKFHTCLDNSSEPKVICNSEFLLFKNNKDGRLSKHFPSLKKHISFYRNHFHYTFAPFSNINKQRRFLEYLETYVKYSLLNQTVSKSLTLEGNSFKKRQQEFGSVNLISNDQEISFKKEPSLFN